MITNLRMDLRFKLQLIYRRKKIRRLLGDLAAAGRTEAAGGRAVQPGPVRVEVTVAAGGGEAAEARLVRGVPALGGRQGQRGGQQQQHRGPHPDWLTVTLITGCRCEEFTMYCTIEVLFQQLNLFLHDTDGYGWEHL